MMDDKWISIHDRLPELDVTEGQYQRSAIVSVKLDDGTEGEGYYFPIQHHSNWFVSYPPGPFRNIMYSGQHVVEWQPLEPQQLPAAADTIPQAILDVCRESGYTDLRVIAGRGVCGINRFAYTYGLLIDIGTEIYGERYCYATAKEAIDALYAWDGVGHPPGDWIKHKGNGYDESNPNRPKQCPFDKTTLVNVGALKEFEDGKDNHICPHCRRIWVDVNQEEWWTRQARVEIVGELSEGSNYADVVKVMQ